MSLIYNTRSLLFASSWQRTVDIYAYEESTGLNKLGRAVILLLDYTPLIGKISEWVRQYFTSCPFPNALPMIPESKRRSFQEARWMTHPQENIQRARNAKYDQASDREKVHIGLPDNSLASLFLHGATFKINYSNPVVKDNAISRDLSAYSAILNISAYEHRPENLVQSEAQVLHIPAAANDWGAIENQFARSFAFLDRALETDAKVLVHCTEGLYRSCGLLVAYLCYRYQEQGLTPEQAFAFIAAGRPIVKFHYQQKIEQWLATMYEGRWEAFLLKMHYITATELSRT